MTWGDAPHDAGFVRRSGQRPSETEDAGLRVSLSGVLQSMIARLGRGVRSHRAATLSTNAQIAQLRAFAETQAATPVLTPLLVVAYACSLLPVIGWPVLLSWASLMIGLNYLGTANARTFLKQPVETIDLEYWKPRFEGHTLAFSLTLSSILFLFWAPDEPLYQNYVISTIAISFAPMTLVTVCHVPIFNRMIIPMVGALILRFLTMGDLGHIIVASVLIIFTLLLRHLALSINSAMSRSINLQSDKNVLIEQLFRAKRDSDAARARAEDANRAKSHFLANMSHELRTPLNAIIGFSEVMATEIFGTHAKPIYKEYSNDINRSGQHLLGLINDILDLSRIEAGRFEIVEEEVNIVEIAKEARHLLQIRADAQGVEVVEDFDPDLPELYADARAMRQIWINLLTNAIKFTPRGRRVTILAKRDPNGDVRFGVHDEGTGISESEIGSVTEVFTQGAAGIAQPGKGSGLGLSIVKGLLQLHCGTLEIRSKLGVGTQAEAVFPEQRLLSVEALESRLGNV